MIERVVRFGQAQHLSGIMVDGTGEPNASQAVGVIMLNAGMIHRVGPFQMHTQLARFLANHKIVSLRFDLSGMGDSDDCRLAGNARSQQIADVLDAVTFLKRKQQCQRIVLLGLCSGAYLGHAVAEQDSSIDGCVFLDGFAFHTPAYFLEQRLFRLFRPRKWMTFARRLSTLALHPGRSSGLPSDNDFFEESTPPAENLRSEVRKLLERNAKLQFIYSGGTTESFAAQRQFAEMFGDLPGFDRLEYHFLPHVDHTYSLQEDRLHMFNLVLNFLRRNFIESDVEPNTVFSTDASRQGNSTGSSSNVNFNPNT